MKKLLLFLLIFGMFEGKAQSFSRYIIKFTDKATTPYSLSNPLPYLSQSAVDRRTRYKIAIDSTDLPVTPRYLDSLRSAGAVTVLNVSKWLNQVSIQTTDAAALAKIRSFPFVEKADPIAARVVQAKAKTGMQSAKGGAGSVKKKKFFQPLSDYFNYGFSYDQIHIHNGEFLHNIGL
ncbi:MAG TPA: hypothetical protein VFL47_15635, partial [Flavisolibacter sp.]|nr:hypothetical protein [Flavisolibacter sp.]